MSTNRQIVEKTLMTLDQLKDSGGYLNPMQSEEFIRLMTDQPTIANVIRTVPMNSPQMEINKLGFDQRILRRAPAEGEYLGKEKRAVPKTDQIKLDTKKVIAEVHLPYDVLEDNIERGNLEQSVMALISTHASRDLEELIITGDEDSGDEYLSLLDGVLKQSVSHVVDLSDETDVTKTVFKAGVKAMPNKYMGRRADMRFFVSPDVETEYVDSLAGRETTLGDNKIQQWTPSRAYGVPVIPAALMPDDNYFFTFPQNVVWGVQRNIMIETDRDIRNQTVVIVLTMRMDVKIEEEDAVVKATGMSGLV